MRAVVLLTAITCVLPRGAWGQGPAAEARPASSARGLAGPSLAPLTNVALPAARMVWRRPAAAPVPLSRSGGGGRVGTLAGWVVGLAIGPALLTGHDLGCDEVECYGPMTSAEASVAGAVVAGGVGYLVGSALALATGLDEDLLGAIRISLSPKGKPGLKVKTSIAF
jgi:hypothetical protein